MWKLMCNTCKHLSDTVEDAGDHYQDGPGVEIDGVHLNCLPGVSLIWED